jgi:hypothetical protein
MENPQEYYRHCGPMTEADAHQPPVVFNALRNAPATVEASLL